MESGAKEGQRPLLSLCMIVRNEEQDLPRCLSSVQGVVDEIVVVDTGSDDATPEIAREFGARVVSRPWTGDFSAARNGSLEEARGEWILFLDADEELEAGDGPRLREALAGAEDHVAGFYLALVNYVGDAPGAEAVLNPAFRVFRNRPGYRFQGAIHEQILAVIQAQGNPGLGRLEVRVNHYGYLNGPAVRKRKIARNLEILERVVREYPDDHFHRFNLGVEYLRLRDYGRALEEFRASFSRLPGLELGYAPVLLRNIVVCLKELERYDEALEVLAGAREAYPDYTDLIFLEGLVRVARQEYLRAADCFRECLARGDAPQHHFAERGVGSFKALYALAQVSKATGDAVQATRCLVQAVRAEPRYTVAAYDLASLLIPREDPAALHAFLTGLVGPGGAPAGEQVVRAFIRHRRYQEALAWLDRVEELSVSTVGHRHLRGQLFMRLRRYEPAMDCFQAAAASEEYRDQAVLNQALCLGLAGRPEDGVASLARVTEDRWALEAMVYRDFLRLLAGRVDRRPALLRPEHQARAEAVVYELLGTLLDAQEFQAFERALDLLSGTDPRRRHLRLGMIYLERGFMESAGEELVAAARLGVRDGTMFRALGRVAQARDLVDDAIVFNQEALALEPDDTGLYHTLATLLARQRRYAEAARTIQAGRRRHPHAELLSVVAQALEAAEPGLRRGQAAEA